MFIISYHGKESAINSIKSQSDVTGTLCLIFGILGTTLYSQDSVPH